MSTERHRPRVSAFLALSLDGFIAGEGNDLAWLETYNGDSQEETGYGALMASADLLLMGRNSYDVVRAFPEWPYGDKPVTVLTHRPATPRAHVSFRQGARHIYLDGGEVVRQGLQAGLVDELTLFWVPVVLGKGVSLFGGEALPERLVPLSTAVLASGLVRVIYRPAP
ncbi:dihydrofolate reductase family protein [Aeromonas rivipollensis]|uniref:dihydrofolate reductase family protein n=1 Tax=Aeromonas rivipollensis TaxID=948519 RepID=UPI000D13BFE3|nr:dihydrofolate reductase family protein [Aeromonas rivipollensis]AVP93075.1 deaminase [Aeromonas rivipollensis]